MKFLHIFCALFFAMGCASATSPSKGKRDTVEQVISPQESAQVEKVTPEKEQETNHVLLIWRNQNEYSAGETEADGVLNDAIDFVSKLTPAKLDIKKLHLQMLGQAQLLNVPVSFIPQVMQHLRSNPLVEHVEESQMLTLATPHAVTF